MRTLSHAPQTARSAAPAFGELLARALARLAAPLRAMARDGVKRRRIRETVDALMSLDSRQLRDLGLSRTEILSAFHGERKDRRIDMRFDI